jgi:RimJ/RimL family protein N-acetyltransferase
MSQTDRTLLRLHVEAVWEVRLPQIVQNDIEVLPGGVQPSWKLLVAEVANEHVHIWRADIIDRERKALLTQATEAMALPSTETTAPGISREVAFHLAAQPVLDMVQAQRIARPLTSSDQTPLEAFQGDLGATYLDAEKQPLIGIVIDGRLMSLAHSSRRTHEACELGVDTLPEARRRGYALAVTILWTRMVIQEGLVPLYSALAYNKASLALAAAAGYRVLAHVVTFEG